MLMKRKWKRWRWGKLRRQGKGIKVEKEERWLSLCMLSLLLRARVGFVCLFCGLGHMQ